MSDSSSRLASYRPLIAIFAFVTFAALALHPIVPFMQAFMGLFLLQFALFKFFDLKGFAKGFRMYDLPTKVLPIYALLYPFLELALGLLYLRGAYPVATNLATLVLMLVSAAGVLLALRRRMNVNCACLGTMLKVPLSTVSVVENVGMAAMAAAMLLTHA